MGGIKKIIILIGKREESRPFRKSERGW